MKKSQIFVLSLLCAVFLPLSSFAKDNGVKQVPSQVAKPKINIESEATKGIYLGDVVYDSSKFKLGKPSIDPSYKKFIETPFKELRGQYKKTGYINLTHLYWRTDVLSLDNNDDIDAFLLLTQCKNVGNLYSNDFEWNELREKTRAYLKANKGKFSQKLKFSQPMQLGEYNFKREVFNIEKKYQYNRSKRFIISNNKSDYDDFCIYNPFSYRYVTYAPYNAVMSTNRPFTLNELPMPKELSRMYVDYLNRHDMEKRAKVVFYISLELFQGNRYEPKSKEKYINEFSGAIDYVEVYADEEETRLLYKMDLR